MREFPEKSGLSRFLACEDGAVAVEYSVIAGAMFLAISPAFYIMRDQIWSKFSSIASFLN